MALGRRREARAGTGTAAGFLLLGAWLCCFHFMYYDMLLTALPLFVLLAEPRKYLAPIFVALLPITRDSSPSELAGYYRPWPPFALPPALPWLQPAYRNIWVVNRMVPNVLLLLIVLEQTEPHVGMSVTFTGYWWSFAGEATLRMHDQNRFVLQPWDTYLIIFLWLWCGISWLRQRDEASTPVAAEGKVSSADIGDGLGQAAEFIELSPDVRSGHEYFADEDRPDPRGLKP
jgi:arabinofuranan 3-O-arabinosyltransferase